MLIRAYFKDGRTAVYTDKVLPLMVTDTAIDYIIDADTGEVIFKNKEV